MLSVSNPFQMQSTNQKKKERRLYTLDIDKDGFELSFALKLSEKENFKSQSVSRKLGVPIFKLE